jgi:hypothetical protein
MRAYFDRNLSNNLAENPPNISRGKNPRIVYRSVAEEGALRTDVFRFLGKER